MPIQHVPAAGDVLMCDYGPDPKAIQAPGVMHGPLAVPPEIHKYRPAVVVSTIGKLSIMVPFSTSVPNRAMNYHVHIPAGTYGFLTGGSDSWLKADLIEAVSHDRLDRPRINGVYQRAKVIPDHLKAIRAACLHAIQLGKLVPNL